MPNTNCEVCGTPMIKGAECPNCTSIPSGKPAQEGGKPPQK